MIHFSYARCPHCNFILDFHLFHVSTGIGPTEVECLKCKESFQSDRKEWPFETNLDRLKFFGFSIFCIVIGGLIGANCIYAAIELWNGNADPKNLPFEDLAFQRNWLYISMGLLAIQLYRVQRSIDRRNNQQGASKESLFSPSFVFGTQFKILIIFVVIWAIGLAKLKFG